MRTLLDAYSFNTAKGPLHEPEAALKSSPPEQPPPTRLIAYYLPQFHPIPENDRFWGTGFTEWTNVTKALPRYVGHYQPRLPADLGFYDLRNPDVLRRQAELARRAGIFGFCIHNYWFNGRRVLETPLEMLLSNPDIDLPFCLNWANENWTKIWDGQENDILLRQDYAGGDELGYPKSILQAIRDPRYIHVNGRPLVMVYRPAIIPNARELFQKWRAFLVANGAGDPYLVMPQTFDETDPLQYGMDAAAGFPPHYAGWNLPNKIGGAQLFDETFSGVSASMSELAAKHLANSPTKFRLFPGVCPSWDNEARRPGRGWNFHGASPELYGTWLKSAMEKANKAGNPDERIVFINAWNEWAEGAYLEPDRHYGFAFLAETRRVIDEETSGRERKPFTGPKEFANDVSFSALAWAVNFPRRLAKKLKLKLKRKS